MDNMGVTLVGGLVFEASIWAAKGALFALMFAESAPDNALTSPDGGLSPSPGGGEARLRCSTD